MSALTVDQSLASLVADRDNLALDLYDDPVLGRRADWRGVPVLEDEIVPVEERGQGMGELL